MSDRDYGRRDFRRAPSPLEVASILLLAFALAGLAAAGGHLIVGLILAAAAVVVGALVLL